MRSQVAQPSTMAGSLSAGVAGATVEHGRQATPGGWFAAYNDEDPAAYRYLMVLRFVLLNLVALAMVVAAWLQGWVGVVLRGDSTHMVVVILGVFLVGMAICTARVLQTSEELNQIRGPRRKRASRVEQYLRNIAGSDGQSRAIIASALRLKLGGRINVVRHLANTLVLLGLIGTVIGFMIALSGVDANAVSDVKGVGPMVSTLIGGMAVALTTTLAGSILNIWLMANYRLLESGTVRLVTAIVECGERHVQP